MDTFISVVDASRRVRNVDGVGSALLERGPVRWSEIRTCACRGASYPEAMSVLA